MGTILEFPVVALAPRSRATAAQRKTTAEVVILPVVRIERQIDETSGGSGPEEGTAPGRRRRRRARS